MPNTAAPSPLILIVDDTPENIQVIGGLLAEQAYDIAVAQSGKQALKFMKRQKPDLVLLDVMMPELDGFEVCRILRGDPSNANVPVIFLSARDDEASILEGFEAGGVDYVTKPFRAKELMARVRTHLELKRTRERLKDQLAEIRTLRGILPICSSCKKIRDDQGFWEQVEVYFRNHSDVEFTHGICPECARNLYPELFDD